MDKLKMHSPDLTEQNIEKLAELFPSCVTESQDDKGNLKRSINFDQLKQELSDHIVEGPQERYELNWPGKREALLTANAPIAKTLRPCREESVDFDTTQNLFIEGDNLDALKLLQEIYLGKVKMIYIDPPYNTGKDFIYEDDFAENVDEYKIRSNAKDEHGNRLISNDESNGRFHSDWLSMIYSRIKLANNLLRDDGIIFISINHKEVSNLKSICDEIFGVSNLLCLFSWRTDGNFDNQAKFKYCHEYILVYAKNENQFPHPLTVDPNTPEESKIFKPEIRNTIVKNGPKNPASNIILPKGFPCAFEHGKFVKQTTTWPHYLTDALVKDSRLEADVEVYSGWSSKELILDFIQNGCKEIFDQKGQLTRFELTPSGAIEAVKLRGEPSHVISSLNNLGGPQKAATEVAELGVIFDDYPKPTDLIRYFIRMNHGDDFIVMDFFAGSASTAHAVFLENKEDSGKRKFILVQLPEECNKNSKAYENGYKNIAEISKDRINKAGKTVSNIPSDSDTSIDTGFRVLKIDSSNMSEIYYQPDDILQGDLLSQSNNIKRDRTDEDLLYQVLLDWGVDLSLAINIKTIDSKKVFFVEQNSLVACFDNIGGIDEAFVEKNS